MSDIAIQTENLGKLYRIGTNLGEVSPRQDYKTLRETISNTVSVPFRRMNSKKHASIGSSKIFLQKL